RVDRDRIHLVGGFAPGNLGAFAVVVALRLGALTRPLAPAIEATTVAAAAEAAARCLLAVLAASPGARLGCAVGIAGRSGYRNGRRAPIRRRWNRTRSGMPAR